ncbi:MAG: NAD+ synthase [Candidatus Omnitrophica bacterium]|nr:NAD+ synthase [Candidatus Omnitrophota bacterium]
MSRLRLALAQLNPTVGDLAGNTRLIAERMGQARAWGAQVVAVPELAVTGYPPEDLLLKPQFVSDNLQALRSLLPVSKGLVALVGFVDRDRYGLYNAAAVLSDGRLAGVYHKMCLPNYGVFDERRYFQPGRRPLVLTLPVGRLGVSICEDIWAEEGPLAPEASAGARLLLNISASPYHAGKLAERQSLLARRARHYRCAVAYCNLVGGQDELVFDGASLIVDARGRLVAMGKQFDEDLVLVDLTLPAGAARRSSRVASVAVRPPVSPAARRPLPPRQVRPLDRLAEIYRALVLGTRDYVRKNGFTTVVVGLSGGIDSALTAVIAVDALGHRHVVGVSMPSPFSSTETQHDARLVANRLDLKFLSLPIQEPMEAYARCLHPAFNEAAPDVTEENLQARIRGNLLMALSNKFGWLVLTTGNKSEMATGYCTLYGDMAGGFAVLKDVPKTLVYELVRYRNAIVLVIPASVVRRVPTAELRPHQTDQDTLPPYPVLDRMIEAYVEGDGALEDLLRRGVSRETAERTIRMIDRSEYKRRQGPPGIKITPKAFGKDRRMPITNRYQAA